MKQAPENSAVEIISINGIGDSFVKKET